MYQPIHSDFLIHWTGKDIDEKHDIAWAEDHSSMPNKIIVEPYLKRLKSILKHGLWMTKNEEDKFVTINNERIKRPWVARTCFTELRLSEARAHAEKFGRLGIGVKRFFLFDRLGSPMSYYHPRRKNWFFPPYINWHNRNQQDAYFSCFLKTMCESPPDKTWKYSFFDESEWRIIYSKIIEDGLKTLKQDNIVKLFRKIEEVDNEEFKNDLKNVDNKKPEYLIPLDYWFAMIIYPNLGIKVEAEKNDEIRKLIEQIKPRKPLEKKINRLVSYERYSKPIEIDLDACRNF